MCLCVLVSKYKSHFVSLIREIGNVKGALSKFNTTLHLQANHSMAYQLRGQMIYLSGDPATALQDFEVSMTLKHFVNCQAVSVYDIVGIINSLFLFILYLTILIIDIQGVPRKSRQGFENKSRYETSLFQLSIPNSVFILPLSNYQQSYYNENHPYTMIFS